MRAEFLLEHGAVDMIVDRRQMRDRIVMTLTYFTWHLAAMWHFQLPG